MVFINRTIISLLITISLVIGVAKNGFSQSDRNGKIVAFHPSVGNSINVYEKKELALFTEYNDSLFESAQLVKYSVDDYTILFKTIDNRSFEKLISIQELDTIYARIEKIKPINKTSPQVDYVFDKEETEEMQKRAARIENVHMIAEISFQIIFVLLEILAQSY